MCRTVQLGLLAIVLGGCGVASPCPATPAPRLVPSRPSPAREASASPDLAEGGVVVVHPIFRRLYATSEHYDGQLKSMGDALGVDCWIVKLVGDERKWMAAYTGDGSKNEDWFSYGSEVLAPISGVVVSLQRHDTVNEPGKMGKGRAAAITIRRPDGVHVTVAHLGDIRVEQGASLVAGQVVGTVGNNGYSRHPHIHLGAYIDETPLQIRFDLRAVGHLLKEVPERDLWLPEKTDPD